MMVGGSKFTSVTYATCTQKFSKNMEEPNSAISQEDLNSISLRKITHIFSHVLFTKIIHVPNHKKS